MQRSCCRVPADRAVVAVRGLAAELCHAIARPGAESSIAAEIGGAQCPRNRRPRPDLPAPTVADRRSEEWAMRSRPGRSPLPDSIMVTTVVAIAVALAYVLFIQSR